jgi:unsaturated rhamnogalacturonyl hydrolase
MVSVIASACDDGPLPEVRVGTPCPAVVMREVNDRWIATHDDQGDNKWARATYFIGNTVAAAALEEPAYSGYTARWARDHDYAVNDGPTTRNADNHCAGQTYLALYEQDPRPELIQPIRAAVDHIIATGERSDWSWIDAQFMASPVFAQLGALTGEAKYVEAMHELYVYARDTRRLFDAQAGLWFRDEDYLYPLIRTVNHKKVFWARGNGWVIASLVRTLEYLDADSPYRASYEDMLRRMATALGPIQRPDGLWNVSLGDNDYFPGPEASGTAFFLYAIAWGINHDILDRATFLPVVDVGWRGLVSVAVRADGELGYVQGVGDQPASSQPVTLRSTRDFGVGAFLLAGSEVMKLGIDFECP